ncbi:hypothetical protein Y032_0262g565, partial [Ancylostoma ceylanicum]
STPCMYEHSDCPQLCFTVSRSERECFCSDHFTFDQHTLVCKAPDNIVVVGNDHGFVVVNLRITAGQAVSYKEDPVVDFTLSNVGTPYSVAMDTSSRLIFWIDAKDQSVIKFTRLIFPAETSILRNVCNCSIFHSLAIDENAGVLYVSCHSLAGVGYVYVLRIKDASSIPLELIGMVISGNVISLATGHLPVPRDITVLPLSNYLFYVDVSPFLPSPAIIQCQLDGRKCEAWLSKDLWPGTRIYADGTYLRLFYTGDNKVFGQNFHKNFSWELCRTISGNAVGCVAYVAANIFSTSDTVPKSLSKMAA